MFCSKRAHATKGSHRNDLHIPDIKPLTETPLHIVVIGGSGGIGHAFVTALLNRFPDATVTATHNNSHIPRQHERLHWYQLDISSSASIEKFSNHFAQIDWLINCVGLLHNEDNSPEKSIRSVNSEFLMTNIQINTLPTLLLAKYLSRAFKSSPAPLMATVSARVGSIEDNRLGGWYSYRISKAALNMALKTLSIEWKQSHPKGCIAALHPGTNETQLSRPFLANIPTSQVFDPTYTATMFLKLLTQLSPAKSGKFWAWDGTSIPW